MIKLERKGLNLPEAKHQMMETIADFQKEPDYKSIRINIDVDPL
jgi:hypothetical protein